MLSFHEPPHCAPLLELLDLLWASAQPTFVTFVPSISSVYNICSTQLLNTGKAAAFPRPGEWEIITGEWEIITGESEIITPAPAAAQAAAAAPIHKNIP